MDHNRVRLGPDFPSSKKEDRKKFESRIFLAAGVLLVLALIYSFFFKKEKVKAPERHKPQVVEVHKVEKVNPTSKPSFKVVYEEYIVKSGDFIVKIAEDHGTSWEEILLANRDSLKERYSEKCENLSSKYLKGKRPSGRARKGHFCNGKLEDPWANTLIPGEIIKIPKRVEVKNPTKEQGIVVEAVKKIAGKNIALVIDDTGSMDDDRVRVAGWYASAIQQMGKDLSGIYLYGDGLVRKINPTGEVSLGQIGGGYENTFAALRTAAGDAPDAIILISDEVGDDWPASEQDLKGLPKVIAHCLPETRAVGCAHSFTRLAQATGGTFVLGL